MLQRVELPELISQATIDVIAAQGLDKANHRNIATAANVSTGALAYYFEGKDALFEAALYKVGTSLYNLTGINDLTGFTSLLPVNAERQKLWKVWLAFAGRAAFSDKLQSIYQHIYSNVEVSLIKKLKISNQEQAKNLATLIIAAIEGIGLCATVQAEVWPPEKQSQYLERLLRPLF